MVALTADVEQVILFPGSSGAGRALSGERRKELPDDRFLAGDGLLVGAPGLAFTQVLPLTLVPFLLGAGEHHGKGKGRASHAEAGVRISPREA